MFVVSLYGSFDNASGAPQLNRNQAETGLALAGVGLLGLAAGYYVGRQTSNGNSRYRNNG